MAVISMKQLLEAGVHFGHQTRRWNPKMAEYIFTERNGIYIIDLQKTVKKIDEAYFFVRDVVTEGEDVLFVGTKKQAQDSIREEAERCGQYFINARWLGGMLTNFKTIRKRVDRLNQLLDMEESGVFNVLPKKEVIKLRGEKDKLVKNLGGIKDMRRLPGALFVVDPRKERIAILEARKLGIPVVAIVDTNCDPDDVDYVIPGNDDAIRAVKLIASKIADSVLEGRQGEQMEDVVETTDRPSFGRGRTDSGAEYENEYDKKNNLPGGTPVVNADEFVRRPVEPVKHETITIEVPSTKTRERDVPLPGGGAGATADNVRAEVKPEMEFKPDVEPTSDAGAKPGAESE